MENKNLFSTFFEEEAENLGNNKWLWKILEARKQ
jgi:hypothetical protein